MFWPQCLGVGPNYNILCRVRAFIRRLHLQFVLSPTRSWPLCFKLLGSTSFCRGWECKRKNLKFTQVPHTLTQEPRAQKP